MSILREAGRLAIVASIPLILIAGGSQASIPDGATLPAAATATPQARNCPIAILPERLPNLATVVDVDALRAALAPELAQAPESAPMLFSIRFMPDGQREWVERIEGKAEAEQLHVQVGRLIAEHTKRQPAGEPWSLRLLVVPGEPAQFHLSHSRVCPVTLERRMPVSRTPARLSRADLEDLQRAGPVRVAVEVSATGRVLNVVLLQRSGSRIADDNVLNSARANRYFPALVDGIPVAGRFVSEARPFSEVRVRRN
jgi:TonB family protein